MPHWRLLVPTKYLCAADLFDKAHDVQIERVELGEMTEVDENDKKKRRKVKKGLVHFKGKSKPLCLNVTNAKTIVDLYGPKTEGWIDRWITIYPTTCMAFGNPNTECIRIKPKAPAPAKAST
jgi:hypothetical protein